jgi:hypothetical protein
MLANLKDKLLWLLGGAVAMTLAFWHLTRRPKTSKAKVDAALAEDRAERVKVEVVPTDIDEVRKRLRERGLLK